MTEQILRLIGERRLYLLIAGGLVVADRVTKRLVQGALDLEESRVVIGGLLDLVHFRNTGVVFGILSGAESEAKAVLLAGFAVVAAAIVIVYSLRAPAGHVWLQSALAMILGGAVGNLYDRLSYGYVVDFLYFHWREFYWPAFNVADASITLGVGLLVIDSFRNETRSRP